MDAAATANGGQKQMGERDKRHVPVVEAVRTLSRVLVESVRFGLSSDSAVEREEVRALREGREREQASVWVRGPA